MRFRESHFSQQEGTPPERSKELSERIDTLRVWIKQMNEIIDNIKRDYSRSPEVIENLTAPYQRKVEELSVKLRELTKQKEENVRTSPEEVPKEAKGEIEEVTKPLKGADIEQENLEESRRKEGEKIPKAETAETKETEPFIPKEFPPKESQDMEEIIGPARREGEKTATEAKTEIDEAIQKTEEEEKDKEKTIDALKKLEKYFPAIEHIIDYLFKQKILSQAAEVTSQLIAAHELLGNNSKIQELQEKLQSIRNKQDIAEKKKEEDTIKEKERNLLELEQQGSYHAAGEIALELGLTEKAKDFKNKLIRGNNYLGAGLLALKLNDIPTADKMLKEQIDFRPGDESTMSFFSKVFSHCLKEKNIGQAKKMAERTLKLMQEKRVPEWGDLYVKELLPSLAKGYIELGNIEEAHTIWKELSRPSFFSSIRYLVETARREVTSALAEKCIELNRQEIINEILAALQQKNDYAGIAAVSFKLGELGKAEKLLEERGEKGGDEWKKIAFNLGEKYLQMGNKEGAGRIVDYLEKTKEYFGAAKIAIELGDVDKFEKIGEKCSTYSELAFANIVSYLVEKHIPEDTTKVS